MSKPIYSQGIDNIKPGSLYRVKKPNQAAKDILVFFKNSKGNYNVIGTLLVGTIVMVLKKHGTYKQYRVLVGDRFCKIGASCLEKV